MEMGPCLAPLDLGATTPTILLAKPKRRRRELIIAKPKFDPRGSVASASQAHPARALFFFENYGQFEKFLVMYKLSWPLRLSARTLGSHPSKRGSIPLEATKDFEILCLRQRKMKNILQK